MKITDYIPARVAAVAAVILLIGTGCKGKSETAQDETGESGTAVAQDFHGASPLGDIPEVVATVNGKELSRSDLEKAYGIVSVRSRMTNPGLGEREILEMAMNELIDSELLKQESVKLKITPESEAVEKELEMIKSQFPDDETFEERLKGRGMTMDELRKNIRDQLAVQEVLEKEVQSKIKVSKEDIEKFYKENPTIFMKGESVRAAHILVKLDETADDAKVEEARKKITGILEKARTGEDFAELARQYSEGPSAAGGGDLGYFERGQMVKPFEEAAFSMKKGEISDVIRTRFGFHILKVYDRKEASKASLEEASKAIERYLTNTQGAKMLNEYLEKLRSAASIEKFI